MGLMALLVAPLFACASMGDTASDELRVKKLVLVDEMGVERATLSLMPPGDNAAGHRQHEKVRLVLSSPSGEPIVQLIAGDVYGSLKIQGRDAVMNDEGHSEQVSGKGGNSVVIAASDGGAGMSFLQNRKPRINLAITSGLSQLLFVSSGGERVASIGEAQEGARLFMGKLEGGTIDLLASSDASMLSIYSPNRRDWMHLRADETVGIKGEVGVGAIARGIVRFIEGRLVGITLDRNGQPSNELDFGPLLGRKVGETGLSGNGE